MILCDKEKEKRSLYTWKSRPICASTLPVTIMYIWVSTAHPRNGFIQRSYVVALSNSLPINLPSRLVSALPGIWNEHTVIWRLQRLMWTSPCHMNACFGQRAELGLGVFQPSSITGRPRHSLWDNTALLYCSGGQPLVLISAPARPQVVSHGDDGPHPEGGHGE